MPSPAAPRDELFARVYDHLRSVARMQLRSERPDHTLSATALVHEAYCKLIDRDHLAREDRPAFFEAAAQAMRRILVDHARRKRRSKRGGGARRIELTAAEPARLDNLDEILAVDEALRRLEEQDAAAARIVRLRFFGGLSVDETAEVLASSPRTIAREWEYARTWLFQALRSE